MLQSVYMWLILQLCGILARLVPSEIQFRAQNAEPRLSLLAEAGRAAVRTAHEPALTMLRAAALLGAAEPALALADAKLCVLLKRASPGPQPRVKYGKTWKCGKSLSNAVFYLFIKGQRFLRFGFICKAY